MQWPSWMRRTPPAPAPKPAAPKPRRAAPPLEVAYGPSNPLPRRVIAGAGRAAPFDYTAALASVIADVAGRVPEFAHLRPGEMLVTVTAARKRTRHGLQARVTPMRFQNGAKFKRVRGALYQVQRVTVGGREVLYVVTFCVPRFLDQPFEEKLLTILHELYHISPAFDGDLRRHPGRCYAHSHSQEGYDAHVGTLVRAYLAGGPDPELVAFLRLNAAQLAARHGRAVGAAVPRPKMVPVAAGG